MTAATKPRSFLLATWEGGGCVTPVLTVASRLLASGHRVRVMSDACNESEARAVGAEFNPWTRAPSRSDRSRETDTVQDWTAQGPDALRRMIDSLWAGRAHDYALDLIEELRRRPVDLVATSEMLFGVAAACEAVGQPFVILSANVSIFPIEGVPPLGPGLAPARDEAERAMHAEIAAFNLALFDHGLPALNAARAALGLSPLAHVTDQADAAEATLLATARAFDFAPETLPDEIRYVGPQLGEPAWAEPWACPLPDDGRPLVLVGFSTTFQNHAGVVQRVIDALAALPARAVVTLGGSLRADELRDAVNVRLVESAPHDAVMVEAALAVTHGGHGTVVRALAHGLPLLVIPHGRDQNDNAVRVTARGAGLSLPASASTEEIGVALGRLISEPAFAEAARRLGAAIASEARETPVVELLEGFAARATARPTLCPA